MVNPSRASSRLDWLGTLLCVGLLLGVSAAHGWLVYRAMGGWQGLNSEWSLAKHDHPLYFHSAWVTQAFLDQSGTTAGYDPYFMAGYAKSIVFPASSTLPEVWVYLTRGRLDVAQSFKRNVYLRVASLPFWMAWAGRAWGLSATATLATVVAYVLYLWTDYPINYADHGMIPYLLAVPLSLMAAGYVGRFLDRGGFGSWYAACVGCVLIVLAHFTTAMVVAPAAAWTYLWCWWRSRATGAFPGSRHLGVWLIPIAVLSLNAFWWWPGILLAETKGISDFAFAHSNESVAVRLGKILTQEAMIQSVLVVLGLAGLVLLRSRWKVGATLLALLLTASGFWGYLAAFFPALDFLQPGRHTYALYSGLCLGAGITLATLIQMAGRTAPSSTTGAGLNPRARQRWGSQLALVIGLALITIRLLGPSFWGSLQFRVLNSPTGEPFLSSAPTPVQLWIDQEIAEHMNAGQRLLYEEGGKDVDGLPDPYSGRRLSGFWPQRHGIEVLGGPYLHAALTTNFTQFGEGSLFGRSGWDRTHFDQYVEAYRPSHILCWTPLARSFCRSNPDRIRIVAEQDSFLFGRITYESGDSGDGSSKPVRGEPGRLIVGAPGSNAGRGAAVDDLVRLRYHVVPQLGWEGSGPPLRPVPLGDDPVPLIGIPRKASGVLRLDLRPPF